MYVTLNALMDTCYFFLMIHFNILCGGERQIRILNIFIKNTKKKYHASRMIGGHKTNLKLTQQLK